jgi:SAM-dependent methyltransferase
MIAMDNRFNDFFQDTGYLELKNYLYNYQIRRDAIRRILADSIENILEVGSGVSPMIDATHHPVIYSDLSTIALMILSRQLQMENIAVAADGCHLPFRTGEFSHVVCSEVLEHLDNDRQALRELHRVLKPNGYLLITFPHRRIYYSFDDSFVGHKRRYELEDMRNLLSETGFFIEYSEKLLGPFDKITMLIATWLFSKRGSTEIEDPNIHSGQISKGLTYLFISLNTIAKMIAKIDCWLTPQRLSAVLLIKAVKRTTK